VQRPKRSSLTVWASRDLVGVAITVQSRNIFLKLATAAFQPLCQPAIVKILPRKSPE
jgi:hypothetical protein